MGEPVQVIRPHFKTALVATPTPERNGGRQVWALRRPLKFMSRKIGLVNVPQGFLTDFASVPRLPFVYWSLNDYGHAAAVVHDYLCRSMMLDRATADAVFYEALRAEGVNKLKSRLLYWGVRIGAPAAPSSWSTEER